MVEVSISGKSDRNKKIPMKKRKTSFLVKEVIKSYTSILKKMNPKFSSSWIHHATISRVPRAQTIFGINSLKTKPPIKTKMRHVYLVNIDQMYPHDRNLNQGIELGMKAALLI